MKLLWGLYVGGLIVNYLDTVQMHIIFFFHFLPFTVTVVVTFAVPTVLLASHL